MAAGMLGADTGALRQLAARFAARGDELAAMPGAIDPELERPELWTGEDADHFRADWQAGPSTALPALGEALDALRAELERQAAEQDACSTGSGAGATGGGSGAAPETAPRHGAPSAPSAPQAPVRGGDEIARELRAIGEPAARREAWAALSSEERRAAIEADPSGIGNLDGIAVQDRADANQLAAQRLHAAGGHGLGGADLNVLRRVAEGEIRAVQFDPGRGDLVRMLGTPGEGARHAIVWAPATGATMADFDDGAYLGIPSHLAQMHPDAVVFVYQRGDWSQKIAPVFGEADRYSNDPAVADRNGQQLAQFQRDVIGTDPHLAGARQAGMGFSYGHSVISAAEQHEARFDKVVSIAGANMASDWRPTPGTAYANFQHSNDMLNIPQTLKQFGGPIWSAVANEAMPGQVPDFHPSYAQHDYGYYSDRPAFEFRPAPTDIPSTGGVRIFDERRLDVAEAHANIAQAGPTNARAVADMEQFLFGS